MIDALYISASGLRGQQEQIDVISNNVANMQTPGFKRGRVNFAQVASIGALDGSAQSVQHGGGSRVMSTSLLFDQGDMQPTQNPMDLAIDGPGFFELEDTAGDRYYTRDGQFRLDGEGYLTATNGMRLAQGMQIPTDASNLQVAPNGEVSVVLAGETAPTVLGTIDLVSFASSDGLVSVGDNVFKATDVSGEPETMTAGSTGAGKVMQGELEMANVDMIDEMTGLVLAQRAYQLNARVLQASDQLLETINNLRR
ncbi:MAG TPA: flagellar hook-basal body complex protein [Rhodanobacter sp.]